MNIKHFSFGLIGALLMCATSAPLALASSGPGGGGSIKAPDETLVLKNGIDTIVAPQLASNETGVITNGDEIGFTKRPIIKAEGDGGMKKPIIHPVTASAYPDGHGLKKPTPPSVELALGGPKASLQRGKLPHGGLIIEPIDTTI